MSKAIGVKKRLIYLVLVVLWLSGCAIQNSDDSPGAPTLAGEEKIRDLKTIRLGERELEVEVVDEPEEITLGLGYRDEIGSEGMLFVMPRKAMYTFWMKGMRIGLDMVWIDCEEGSSTALNQADSRSSQDDTDDLQSLSSVSNQECEVVDVTEKVPAPEDAEDVGSLKIYQPIEPVTHVLEVEFGKVEEWGIGDGDGVVLN